MCIPPEEDPSQAFGDCLHEDLPVGIDHSTMDRETELRGVEHPQCG